MLEEQVTGRWLPAVGLDGLGPPRRASVGEPDGRHVWHVYDDLGAWGLDREDVDTSCLEAAMDRSRTSMQPSRATPCSRNRGSPPATSASLLRQQRARRRPVPRRSGRPRCRCRPRRHSARDAVEGHLARLLADEPRRIGLLREQAGPETVVHGDLTRANVFVPPALGGRGARGSGSG